MKRLPPEVVEAAREILRCDMIEGECAGPLPVVRGRRTPLTKQACLVARAVLELAKPNGQMPASGT